MSESKLSKHQLRGELRQRRNAMDAAQRNDAALQVAAQIQQLSQWSRARRIAVYLAADGELDPSHLVARARQASKEVFLPVIKSDQSLSFALWREGDALHLNQYGIAEPGADVKRCPASELDILFMPLVAWDRHGNRLGMGGGFYDRTLAGVSAPLKVGLAYAVQELPQLPRDDWDSGLDFVATEISLHRCQGSD